MKIRLPIVLVSTLLLSGLIGIAVPTEVWAHEGVRSTPG